MKLRKPTNLILLTACSGALFFGFSGNDPESTTIAPTQTETIVNAQTTSKQPKITQTDVSAKQAIKTYKDEFPKSDVKSLSLEKKMGKYYYEVEGVGNQKEHELTIDANSKKVSDKGTENLDKAEQDGVKRKEDKLKTKNLLSVKKAVKEAQKKVKSGKVTDISLNKSLGITYWEVEFQQSNKQVEVSINANNGKFLSKETSELDD